jgi:copper resistance protein B
LQGLAPYFFQVETALFVGESGDTAIRLEAEYELLFTQRLILSPQIEMNLYGQNNMDLGVGSGLSDLSQPKFNEKPISKHIEWNPQ